LTGARIGVIRQFYFPCDTRVRREVHALASAGHEVDVICMRRPGQPLYERSGSVAVYRVPLEHKRGGPLRYLFEYVSFPLAASLCAGALAVRRRWDVVQVNTLPDWLVFAAIVPRLLGARVLLDLHECMPEFFATKFASPSHPAVRLLARLEQASIRFADLAITCTEQMRAAFIARGAQGEKIEVILNSADEEIFDPQRHPPTGSGPDRFVVLSHGSIEERYGLDTAIRAVARLAGEIPGLRLDIFGEGAYADELQELAEQLGIEDRVFFSDGLVPLDELLRAIATADAGLVAMKRDSFRDLTHTNKMFDFIAMRRPVIVSRTASVEAYFDESCFQLFDSGDDRDLATAIRELHANAGLGERLVRRAAEVNEPYRWPRQRELYLRVVERLRGAGSGAPGERGRGL
jgi:glycosyltransferase involved in cell wall biosynthesis